MINILNNKLNFQLKTQITRLESVLLLLRFKFNKFLNILVNTASGELLRELIYNFDPRIFTAFMSHNMSNINLNYLQELKREVDDYQRSIDSQIRELERALNRKEYLGYWINPDWFDSAFIDDIDLQIWFIKFADADLLTIIHEKHYADRGIYYDVYSTKFLESYGLKLKVFEGGYSWLSAAHRNDRRYYDDKVIPYLIMPSYSDIIERFSRIDKSLPNDGLMENILKYLHINFIEYYELNDIYPKFAIEIGDIYD